MSLILQQLQQVLLNLVIAVILDNFESYNQAEDLPVSESDFGEYAYEWGKLDRFASYYIKVQQLPTLLKRLNAPLGFKSSPSDMQKAALSQFLLHCGIENQDGKIHFVDTLQALASRVDGIEKPPGLASEDGHGGGGDAAEDGKIEAAAEEEAKPDTSERVAHYFAALTLQCAWKGKLARRAMEIRRQHSRKGKAMNLVKDDDDDDDK